MNGEELVFDFNRNPFENHPALEFLMKLPQKTSREIKNSLMGLGFETLDRQTFNPKDFYDLVGETGIKHVRCQTGWIRCERVRGQYDFSWLDDIVDSLAQRGIRTWFSLSYGNPLYTPVPEYEEIFRAMETVLPEKDKGSDFCATFILTGSRINAMKYIFEEKKYFWRMTEHLPLPPVDSKEIVEHIVKGFLVGGKVIERDLAAGAVKLFRSNIWYLNHFISICDSLSKGYINEGVLMEALKIIISIHEPRFFSMTNSLTDHQLSLMKAILDGEIKFSASDVIEKYRLNSSANVRRVKDALKKKEIITFNEKDEPVILDPLFEYWLRRDYFEMETDR